jgi:hypothetical protein
MRVGTSGAIAGLALLLSACAVLMTACGYRALDGRGAFGDDVKTIELRTFDNESREPGLEQMIGDAMVEEFGRRAWLEPELAGSQVSPDLVLRGVVHSATVRSTSYSSGALALEERIEVRMDVDVRRGGSGELVYQHPDFRMTEVFLSSADPQVYASNKEQALRRLSSAVAERVHDELFERF